MKHLILAILAFTWLVTNTRATTLDDDSVIGICERYKKTDEFAAFTDDCELIAAMAKVESMYEVEHYNPELSGSYGLLQVQCTTAKMVGLKFNCEQLFNQKINIRFGMKYIMYLRSNKYTNVTNIRSLIAAYNSGTAYLCKKYNPGKCYPGEHVNYNHVNKVYRHYKYLKGDKDVSRNMFHRIDHILPSSFIYDIQTRRKFRACIKWNMGNCSNILFWHDYDRGNITIE